MQKLLYLLILMGWTTFAQAQFRVLLVDDSGDNFGNAEYLAPAFDSLGYGARVLTYGFDLALAANFDSIRHHVGTVLDWWQGELNPTQSPTTNWEYVQISPNAFSDHQIYTAKLLKKTR